MRYKSLTPLIVTTLGALPVLANAAAPMTIEIHLPALKQNSGSGAGRQQLALNSANLAVAGDNTAKLLDHIPGGDFSAAGGVSALPVLNGFSDNQLLVQVNGFSTPNACANHMNPPLSYLSPSAIGRITVYPTVVPANIGGNAIGGAIIIDAPQPVFANPGSVFLSSGSFGGFFQSNGDIFGVNLNAIAATRHFSIRYSGSYSHGNNYKAARAFKPVTYGIAGDVVASSLYEAEYQNLNAAYRWNHQLLELGVQYQNIPYQGFPSARMDMTGNHSTRLNLHYQTKLHWGELELRAYNQVVQHSMNFLNDKMLGAMMDMPMNTQGVNNGIKVKFTLPTINNNRIQLGASYNHEHLNDQWPPVTSRMSMMGPNTFLNINNGRRDRYDIFTGWKRHWNSQWSSDVAMRLDIVDMNTGAVQGYNPMMYGSPSNPTSLAGRFNDADRRRSNSNWNTSIILHYVPGTHSDYTLGLARKSQSPSLYELYTWSGNPMAMNMIGWFNDGNGYIGNLNLQPETANTLSFDANFHAANPQVWQLKIQPYYTYIPNYIGALRCPTNLGGACTVANQHATSGFVYLQFTNQKAALWGINLSAKLRLAQTDHFGMFTLDTKAAYVHGENLSTHTPLYHMMPANLRLALHQEWGSWRNTIEEQLVAPKNRVDPLRNEPHTSGYGLFNLRTSYHFGHWQASLALENVFNQYYEQPLGGLYLGQRPMIYGITLPGPGRSVNMNVNYTF